MVQSESYYLTSLLQMTRETITVSKALPGNNSFSLREHMHCHLFSKSDRKTGSKVGLCSPGQVANTGAA